MRVISIIILVVLIIILVYNKKGVKEGFNLNKDVYLVTYGNKGFENTKQRLKKEALQFGIPEKNIFLYDDTDLSNDFKETVQPVLNYKRGGGYWIWKPYIINKALKNIPNNKYLIYLDAGSTIQLSGQSRFNEYINMINENSNKSILVHRLNNNSFLNTLVTQEIWTTEAIYEYFNIKGNDPIRKINQIAAGAILIRKTDKSVALIEEWLKVSITKPELFTDMYNDKTKDSNPFFIENRHDQSIFSILVDLYKDKYGVEVISEELENKLNIESPFILTRIRK